MKRPIPRMTESEITELVTGLAQGRIYTGSQVPSDLLSMVFMPLALGGLEDIDVNTLGNVVEDIGKAGELSVNGYPIFMSCRLVHKDDWEIISERALKAHEALMDAATGEVFRGNTVRRENL